MSERLLFLTGHLAHARLRGVLESMGETPFRWETRDVGVKVAALMTEAILPRCAADAAAVARPLDSGLGEPVIGSESQRDAALIERCRDDARVALSLDFRGDDFLGPRVLLERSQLWPRRVIAMTPARVGAGQGPDVALLRRLAAQGARALYAGGGVRDGAARRAHRRGRSGAIGRGREEVSLRLGGQGRDFSTAAVSLRPPLSPMFAEANSLALALAVFAAALLPGVRAETAFITNDKGNTITVVDLATMAVVKYVEVGRRPRGIALSKDEALLYVCLGDDTAPSSSPPPRRRAWRTSSTGAPRRRWPTFSSTHARATPNTPPTARSCG